MTAVTATSPAASQADVKQAISAMIDEYGENEWLIREHFRLNEPHVEMMARDLLSRVPPVNGARLLDVGCYNGWLSYIFAKLGYRVTGTDIGESPELRRAYAKVGGDFFFSNFNHLDPFADQPAESFDAVLLIQVMEHILNHPRGLIDSIARLTRPGGVLVLTTPNPANAMNAARTLLGRPLSWGTQDFMELPKIRDGEIISVGEIHYREYTREELVTMLERAGFRVEKARFVGLGASESQPALKRWLKNSPLGQGMMSMRLFASNHYIVARREG